MSFFVHQREDRSVTIGGIRLLSEFSHELVEFKIKGGIVKIEGEHLRIERFDMNEVEVVGKIHSVTTERAGRGFRGGNEKKD